LNIARLNDSVGQVYSMLNAQPKKEIIY